MNVVDVSATKDVLLKCVVITHFYTLLINLFFQIFRLHSMMFGVVILVVSVVCLAMLVLITTPQDADD